MPRQQHQQQMIDAPGDVLIDLSALDDSSSKAAAAAGGGNSSSSSSPALLDAGTSETPFAAPAAQSAAPSSVQSATARSTAAAAAAAAAGYHHGGSSSSGGGGRIPQLAAGGTQSFSAEGGRRHTLLDSRRFHSQHFWLSDNTYKETGDQPELYSGMPPAVAAAVAHWGHDRNPSTSSFEQPLNGNVTDSDSQSGSPSKQGLMAHWRRHEQHQQQHQQHQHQQNLGQDPVSGEALSPIASAGASSAEASNETLADNGSFADTQRSPLNPSFGGQRRSNMSYAHGQVDPSCLSESALAFSVGLDSSPPPGGVAAAEAVAVAAPAEAVPKTPSRSKLRWQKAAEQVVQLNKSADKFKPWGLQGLDVRRHNYSEMMDQLNNEVKITVADYSKEQVQVVGNITNDSLSLFLDKPRPEWSKVRWLNVQGLSWDVIQTLAVAYELHPLSVEDIVHVPQRIKADYYQEYLYASVLLLSVEQPSQLTAAAPLHSDLSADAAWDDLDPHPRPHSPSTNAGNRSKTSVVRLGSLFARHQIPPPVTLGHQQHTATLPRKRNRLRTRLLRPSRSRAAVAANSTSSLHKMELMVEQASLFLFRDGTVVSMFSNEGEGVAETILERLKGFKTLLTDSEDSSFLFNTILDAVVDRALPVTQIYASRIAALETQILVEPRPPADITKELHLLGNDLKVLRRTLVPTQHLIHKLQSGHTDKGNSQGFLSPLTVVYLSDVLDHISTIVEDMETLAIDTRDLIDLVFNTIAHRNNNSMQMLAVVSTIFLPITFIAGVYGTNFDQWFPEIHWHYGYIYFWGTCAFVTILFMGLLKYWGMFQR